MVTASLVTGDKVMQGWGHCPGLVANSKITGWAWSGHQNKNWGGQGHRWHWEVSVPCGDKKDRMMEKLLYVPGPKIPLSCSWLWCRGCVPSPHPKLEGTSCCVLWGGDTLRRHADTEVMFLGGGVVFCGGQCHGGLPAGEGCVGCVHGGHQGSAMGGSAWWGEHVGANWGHQPCPPGPWGHQPCPPCPYRCRGQARLPRAGPRGEETSAGPGWGREVPQPFLRPRMQILHKHSLSHTERGERMSQGKGTVP